MLLDLCVLPSTITLIFSIFYKYTPWVAIGEIIQKVYHIESKDECILNRPTGTSTMQLLYLVQTGFSQSNLEKIK